MSAIQQMLVSLGSVAKMPASAVLHWSMNSNSKDYSNSINGVDTAISYVAGKKGNAASFNGSTSQIIFNGNVPYFTDMGENFWMSFWINPASLSGDRMIFSTVNNRWQIAFNGTGNLWFKTSGSYWQQVGSSVSASVWQHLLFVQRKVSSTNYCDIYKDNVFVETIAMGGVMGPLNASQPFQLGRADTTSYYYNGLMDNVTFGTGIPTAAERTDLYMLPDMSDRIAFDTYGGLALSGVTITTTFVQSWSHTNNGTMLVAAFIPAATGGTPINNVSATYNGVAMTRIGSSYLFYLANPPIGTYNISYTVNFNSSLGSCAVVYHSASYNGTTTPPSDYSTAYSAGYLVNLAKAKTSAKSWHVGVAYVNNFRTLIANTNCVLRGHQTIGVSVCSDSGIVDSIGQGFYPGNQTLEIQNNDGNNSGASLETFTLSI